METFFKRIIVSDKNIVDELSELEKVDNLKTYKLEYVAEDCESSIHKLLNEEVVLEGELKKIKTDKDKTYYLTHQSAIAFKY